VRDLGHGKGVATTDERERSANIVLLMRFDENSPLPRPLSPLAKLAALPPADTLYGMEDFLTITDFDDLSNSYTTTFVNNLA
jgi:hypothetical protein